MTLEEARADILAQARLDVDLYTGVTIDAEGNEIEEAEGLTDLIDRAVTWWAKLTYCCYEPSTSFVLTIGTDTYSGRDRSIFGARILKPRTVVINSSILYRRDGKNYGLWTMEELQRYYPSWRTAADAQSSIAIWLPTNKLMLYPPPDAAYTGLNFVEGWVIPDTLTEADDTEELPVPEEDHSAIVRLALAFGSLSNVSEGEAWQRIAGNDAFWREHAERRKRENLNSFLGRKTRGGNPDWTGY